MKFTMDYIDIYTESKPRRSLIFQNNTNEIEYLIKNSRKSEYELHRMLKNYKIYKNY